jgi:hypothetical protein
MRGPLPSGTLFADGEFELFHLRPAPEPHIHRGVDATLLVLGLLEAKSSSRLPPFGRNLADISQ